MKVLQVHNLYGSSAPSGENQCVDEEAAMLTSGGHDVLRFSRTSDEIRAQGALGTLRGALSTPWNPRMARAIKTQVMHQRPNIVHVHNTFPLISNAIFRAIGGTAARVLTLHNYRIFCPAAIPMRDGQVCTACLDQHSVWPAVQHGCYRGSRLATLPLATSVALHRRLNTWTEHVDAFIALSEFQRTRLVEAGLPADLVHVKPNFFPGDPAVIPWASRRPTVVFAGRLTKEKGVEALVQAWLRWGEAAPELRLLGDGELRVQLEPLCARSPKVPIRFVGQVTSEKAQSEIAHASLMVLPSKCFEGFPMVIREAFAFGTPVAASALGPLPSIVRQDEAGVLFPPADPDALLEAIRTLWNQPAELERLGQGARQAFETLYTEQANLSSLLDIYTAAHEVSRERRVSR